MSRPSSTPISCFNCQFKQSSDGYVKITEKRVDVGKASHLSLQNQSAVMLKYNIISTFISNFIHLSYYIYFMCVDNKNTDRMNNISAWYTIWLCQIGLILKGLNRTSGKYSESARHTGSSSFRKELA